MANTIRDASGLKYVEMQNARFARKPLADLFNSGSWSTIRVAMFLKINDSGADMTGSPIFSAGLCSGTTNIPGDTTPTNAVGIAHNKATWSRNTSAGNQRYYFTTFAAWKNVAGTPTVGSNLITDSAQIMMDTYSGSGDGSPFFVDVIKGSPNFSLRLFVGNQVTNVPTMSYAQYLAQAIATTPSFTNCAYTAAQTIAFSESGGTLDAAWIYWGQSNALRVLDWRVVRIA